MGGWLTVLRSWLLMPHKPRRWRPTMVCASLVGSSCCGSSRNKLTFDSSPDAAPCRLFLPRYTMPRGVTATFGVSCRYLKRDLI